jgi:hypothetical protein
MTLSNVVRVFNSKRQLLQSTGDFSEAWSLLLGLVEHSALSKNNEVRFSFKLVSRSDLREVLYIAVQSHIQKNVYWVIGNSKQKWGGSVSVSPQYIPSAGLFLIMGEPC